MHIQCLRAKRTPDTLLSVDVEEEEEEVVEVRLSSAGEMWMRPFMTTSPEPVEEAEIFLVGGRDQCLPGTFSCRLLLGGGATERGKL